MLTHLPFTNLRTSPFFKGVLPASLRNCLKLLAFLCLSCALEINSFFNSDVSLIEIMDTFRASYCEWVVLRCSNLVCFFMHRDVICNLFYVAHSAGPDQQAGCVRRHLFRRAGARLFWAYTGSPAAACGCPDPLASASHVFPRSGAQDPGA